jgi:hypothetical protein
MKLRHIVLPLLVALAVGVMSAADAQAGKKPPTPPPPPPPPNQVIAFGATFGRGKNAVPGIYTMNDDGSNVTLVYRNFTRPSWSADGTRIAASLEPELRRFNADGSDALLLASDTDSVTRPRWSPITDPSSPIHDLIAYSTSEYDLVLIGAEGGRRTELLQGTAHPETYRDQCSYAYPDWSRDGRVLVATSLCRPGDVWEHAIIIVPLDSPLAHYEIYRTTDDPIYAPKWARQRDALLFNTLHVGPQILELQVDASGTYSAAGPPTALGLDLRFPGWSPDDSKLVGWYGGFGGVSTYEFASENLTFLANGGDADWKR